MAEQEFLRMVLTHAAPVRPLPRSISIERYSRTQHSDQVRHVFGQALKDEPWPQDWDSFEEFDPKGVFVAQHHPTDELVGYVISFKRRDMGYISVVAVIPAFRRQGIASALIRAAIGYLHSLHLSTVKIDAFADSIPAVETYKSLGFEAENVSED
jgi:ribosomal-protein-alanine N-acetyltransferase